MISLHMQGGCLCENMPGLRVDTNNVEIAGTIAPRPLLMVSATGDWTAETLEAEYPAMRGLYDLMGAGSKVLWILALIIFPIVSVIAYLCVHGSGAVGGTMGGMGGLAPSDAAIQRQMRAAH